MLAVEVVEQYLKWLSTEVDRCNEPRRKRSRAKTLEYYRYQLGALVKVLPAGLEVAQVKAHHLDARSNSWHFCQAAKRVFKWAADTERIEVCPLRSLKLPDLGERQRILTADEFERILRASHAYFQDFLWCQFRTGARPIELRELEWRHVDWNRRVLIVEHYKGKRRRKVKAPTRDIPIDEEVRDLLRTRQQYQERTCNGTPYVFTGRHGQPLTSSSVVRNFAAACRRAGIDQSQERAVSYTLRHTAATSLTVDGMGQKLLAEILGHAKILTTERYQHLQSAHTVAALDTSRLAGRRAGNPLLKIERPGRKPNQQLSLFE